ncbi:MAG: hypothetical protein ABSD11_10085, partial [Methylocella sp.]
MIDDDLNAPLGQFWVRKRPSLGKLPYIGVALGALGLLGTLGTFSPELGRLAFQHAGIGVPAPTSEPHKTTSHQSTASLTALAPRTIAESSRAENAPFPDAPVPGAQVAVLGEMAGHEVEAIERRSGVKIIRPG